MDNAVSDGQVNPVNSASAATPAAGQDDANATAPPIVDSDANSDSADPDSAASTEIVPNDTILTNDRSVVGERRPGLLMDPSDPNADPDAPPEPPAFVLGTSYKPPAEQPAAESTSVSGASASSSSSPDSPILSSSSSPAPELAPALDAAQNPAPLGDPSIQMPTPTVTEPEDATKAGFIKTYTKEFDETLRRAAESVQEILDSVDKVVREHSSSIVIPPAANEFLAEAPENGEVSRFEDARAIVNQIIDRAQEAKQKSELAAAEAAQIYDEVQKFKVDTKEQLAKLVSEFN